MVSADPCSAGLHPRINSADLPPLLECGRPWLVADPSDAESSRRTATVATVAAVAVAVAVALIVVGIVVVGGHAVWLEGAKAGFQIVVIVLLGTAVTYGLRQLDEARAERSKKADIDREEERRRRDYRLGVFRDAVGVFTRVRTVRRSLRALGVAAGPAEPLVADTIAEFNLQMRALNEAQLSLERIEREIRAQPGVFPGTYAEIEKFHCAEKFLRSVLEVWERSALTTHHRDEPQREALDRLDEFLAPRRQERAQAFWSSFQALERAARKDLIAPHEDTAPAPTPPRE